MFDNYLSIISATPKVAFIALIIIGAILFFEILSLLRIKKAAEKQPEKEFKVPKPYKFFLVQKSEENITPAKSLNKPLLTLTAVLIFLIAAISLFIFISRQNLSQLLDIKPPPLFTISQTLETNNNGLSPEPSAISKEKISLKIYRFVDEQMIQVYEPDLKKLKAGEKIIIVVEKSNAFEKAIFSVNDTPIATFSSKKDAHGNLFEEYTIPPNEKDFKIFVQTL